MSIKSVFWVSNQLWVTDGTSAGTTVVSAGNYYYNNIIALGNEVISTYNGNIEVTNGSSSGTIFITPQSGNSYYYYNPVILGSNVIAQTNNHQFLLTDGTAANTKYLAYPTLPYPFSFYVDGLTSLGNKAIFNGTNVHSNYNGSLNDLWVTDGTVTGTRAIIPTNAATSGLNPRDFTVIGNKALFHGVDNSSNYSALWVTDGTDSGTYEISTPALPAGSVTNHFLAFGSRLLFEAYGIDNKYSLWITDGTNAGTNELYALPYSLPGIYQNEWLNPIPFIAVGNQALFWGEDSQSNWGLWITDGTTAGTNNLSVNGLSAYPSRYQTDDAIAYGNRVLFRATNSVGKDGLWITDGTSLGTYEIATGNAYFYGLEPTNFALAGNKVVFNGRNASGINGLWTTDGTVAGTYEITVSAGGAKISLNPSNLTTFGIPLISITGTLAGQSITDQAVVQPFKNIIIGDTGTGESETVTVVLSAAANGILSNLGSGTYDAVTGTYSVSGSASVVTAALRNLIFSPTAHQVAPGQSVTTTFIIKDVDTTGYSTTDTTSTVVATGVATSPVIVNVTGGSYRYVWFPTPAARETITQFNGANATGAIASVIVDNVEGTSYIFAYNPSPSAKQTTQKWSSTNAANGAPSGALLADIVNKNDGSTLVYSYNPTDGVAQTITNWSATNADGSAAGTKTSAVVDSADGKTSIVYAYKPTPNVLQTATYFGGYDSLSGAPVGSAVSATVDFAAGLGYYGASSAIYHYNATGAVQSIEYYSGPDGTGQQIRPSLA